MVYECSSSYMSKSIQIKTGELNVQCAVAIFVIF
jgi:hypothetical protein